MSDNPLENYVSSSIKSTFQNIIHRGSDGILYGGSGSLITIPVNNLPTTGISASYVDGLDGKLNTSSFASYSSSISSRITNEEILSGVFVSTSASLSRYNVDSGSFNSKIDSKLNTSSFNLFSSSYSIDSSSFSSSLNNKVDKNSNATLTGVLFNTSSVASPAIGQLTWNDTDGTLDLGLKGGNVTLQIGQENIIRVVNKTGANLLESQYKAVKIKGAQGQRPSIELAQASTDIKSETTIGLVTENINNNQEGFITTEGLVRGINTTGALQGETWSDGDILYLSPTTAGVLTNIEPVAPAHRVSIGYLVYAHNTQGKIFVKIDNGTHLAELHDVRIISASNGQALVYDGVTWKNMDLSGSFITTSSFNEFTSSISASSILFIPSGKIESTDVQSALQEVDLDKQTKIYYSDTSPTGSQEKDEWYNTSTGGRYVRSGSVWIETVGAAFSGNDIAGALGYIPFNVSNSASLTQIVNISSSSVYMTPYNSALHSAFFANDTVTINPNDTGLASTIVTNGTVSLNAGMRTSFSVTSQSNACARYVVNSGQLNNSGFSWSPKFHGQYINFQIPVVMRTIWDNDTMNATSSGFIRGYLGCIGTGNNYTGSVEGIGFHVNGTRGIQVVAHNGSTFTTSSVLATIPSGPVSTPTNIVRDVIVYSNGSGSVSLYLNKNLMGTISGGPTGSSSTVNRAGYSVEIGNGGDVATVGLNLRSISTTFL